MYFSVETGENYWNVSRYDSKKVPIAQIYEAQGKKLNNINFEDTIDDAFNHAQTFIISDPFVNVEDAYQDILYKVGTFLNKVPPKYLITFWFYLLSFMQKT